MAIHLYTESVTQQKLDYIHNNPLAEHWKLSKDIFQYEYSSASFYENNKTKFCFLKNVWFEAWFEKDSDSWRHESGRINKKNTTEKK